jgi:hypothetical protein
MLALTRPHRQVLATLALFAFTVAPTGFVAWTAWRVNRPEHVRGVELELGRQLGVAVTLEGVRYPRPGEVVYRGITLRQEEAGRDAARLTEVARADVARLRTGERDLAIEGLRLRTEGPRQAMAQVAALLQRVPGAEPGRISLSAPSCRIDLGAGLSYMLRDVVGQFQLQGGRRVPTVTVSYLVAPAGSSPTRCELVLSRDRGEGGTRTELAFETKEGPPLPARVLDPFFDSAGWLGPEARVEGRLALSQAGAGEWGAEFQGTLLDVDLDALVHARFPDHHLNGRGRVAVAKARWGDRPGGQGFGWVEARGTLSAGPGTISAGLLRALGTEMRFHLAGRADPLQRRDLEFHGLGLAFAIGGDGQIRLAGALGDDAPAGAVLVRGDRLTPLALAPEGSANVRGLWKALFPTDGDREVLVPVKPESQVLRYLPLPPGHAGQAGPVQAN